MYQDLKEFWHYEAIGINKEFSYWKLFRIFLKNSRKKYYVWFRLAYVLHRSEIKFLRSWAKRINKKLIREYGVEIMLGAKIGLGLKIEHYMGIVITDCADIGDNFIIRQNTTIGVNFSENSFVKIGNNVDIGANSCIIATGNITIGDNVKIGAMSFVNKDIPSNVTYITIKNSKYNS